MTHTYIKFENLTQAEKAKSVLSRHGIKAYLKRNPNPDHRQGCNFVLSVSGDIWQAYGILNRQGITGSGVESYRDRL